MNKKRAMADHNMSIPSGYEPKIQRYMSEGTLERRGGENQASPSAEGPTG